MNVVVVLRAGHIVRAIPCDGTSNGVATGIELGLELAGCDGYDVKVYPSQWSEIRALLLSHDPLQGRQYVEAIRESLERVAVGGGDVG